jgi:Tfp pilus assembly protein PilN
MPEINLLPEDIHPKAKVYRLAGIVSRLCLVLAVVLVFSASGAAVFYYINSAEISKSQTSQADLTSQVEKMQAVEQKIVLLKDRADKIDMVRKGDSTEKQMTYLQEIGNNVPEGSTLNSLAIAKGRVDEEIAIPDSSSFLKFVSSLTANKNFSDVVLESLNYSDKEGYLLSLTYTY